MDEREEISLANLGHGAAIEKFDHELKRVLENIQDPNTDAESVREVRLVVAIKPDLQREMSAYNIKVSSKLAPCSPHGSRLFMGVTPSGRCIAFEVNPNQLDLFTDPEPERNDKVAPLRSKEVNGD